MSAHGEERDWTGMRSSARKLVVTRPSSGRFGRRPGATPSDRRTECQRLWWRATEGERWGPGPVTGDRRLNASLPPLLSHSTSSHFAVPACARLRPVRSGVARFGVLPILHPRQRRPPRLARHRRAAACRSPLAPVRKRDTLLARCVAHISSSLPPRGPRALIVV
jgi:hypothetical protein